MPEGGSNDLAILGCQEILSDDDLKHYDVICCAVGTGGTILGLIEASLNHQTILGFSALKGDFLQKFPSKPKNQIGESLMIIVLEAMPKPRLNYSSLLRVLSNNIKFL